MNEGSKERAVVYCEEAFATTNGKTAHGLLRFSMRYEIVALIDSTLPKGDAGQYLDGRKCNIPIVHSLAEVMALGNVTQFIIGLTPDGGKLNQQARSAVIEAISEGLHVTSGLHDYLSEDEELSELALSRGVTLHDVRKPPCNSELHFFSGAIEDVTALTIAVLGTDSAVGKRTSAWKLWEEFNSLGLKTEFIGTGQTAWLQGATYSIVLDSLVNDFVSGEIEHAVVSAWRERDPDVIIVEGQGSLLHPAYPGGFEILAAARPDLIVLQHAPGRKVYDGFPAYSIHPLDYQIQALEVVSQKPIAAITLNHDGLTEEQLIQYLTEIELETGILTSDILREGPNRVAKHIISTYWDDKQ